MSKDHSFDVVSKVDLQELKNAVQMAQKEIQTRFDFKGSSAAIQFLEEKPPAIRLTADHVTQLKSVADVLQGKLVRRGVALKAFDWQEPEVLPAGGAKQQAVLQQGLSSDKGREISKTVKTLGLKVEARIEGDSVRISANQIDDLQSVIQALRAKNFEVPLQFENYR
jgi:cyclic-di-GMP-binding protein